MSHQLLMTPAPGQRLLRFVGDRLRFTLCRAGSPVLPPHHCARLRTNLGRAAILHREIIESYSGKIPVAGASWRDIPMKENGGLWTLEITLTEVGFFQAKAYAVDADGRQYWPEGPDFGVSVHPSAYRTGNTIYCAFARMFGETKTAVSTENPELEPQLAKLDKHRYTVIPSSGKLRDLMRELPHIMDVLGCRILHLLPVNPTPTTYARFGRFGSPYAALDLTAIDPALVEFDRRTTGVDQFRELTYATHLRGGRVFLDIVINHTGWGSRLQEEHPEWFLRDHNGIFVSPGAWGVVWEDLVELNHGNPASWDTLAEMFLIWCGRGVDGFRCDAGYKVPMHAWRYVTARVRAEYPETIFLLEGLGGSWAATENLLTEGGMQWAYSELFQNYSGPEVAWYLDYALSQSRQVGLYVNYSETHDNNRLARRGGAWSLLRNRLCALTSASGAYGFTCGMEWLATEKIKVHGSSGMAWGSRENIIPELAALNRLLVDHPCFLDGATLTRLSEKDSAIYALERDSDEGLDRVLVLVNIDVEREHTLVLSERVYAHLGQLRIDLLTGAVPEIVHQPDRTVAFKLGPGSAVCLSASLEPRGLSGAPYRRLRACASFGFRALAQVLPIEETGEVSWREIAAAVQKSPAAFLGALPRVRRDFPSNTLMAAIAEAAADAPYRQVVVWRFSDLRRIALVPPNHWLLIESEAPFRISLDLAGNEKETHEQSIEVTGGHVASFPPQPVGGDARLRIERYATDHQSVKPALRFLAADPPVAVASVAAPSPDALSPSIFKARSDMVLLTNGRGGMARMCVNLGHVRSKYDCVLGANLHPSVPVDRHIFVKRVRAWSVAEGFITPLDEQNLFAFEAGPPARWRFVANAGDGRTIEIHLEADMLEGRNTTVLRFTRPPGPPPLGRDLPDESDARVTVRVDIEDRNFHWETKRNSGAEHHFQSNTRPLHDRIGFEFTPASDRQLRVAGDAGRYHHEIEWCENIRHPVEESRGQNSSGDAFSPGWFRLPLVRGKAVTLFLSADPAEPSAVELAEFADRRRQHLSHRVRRAALPETDSFGRQLAAAAQAFVVQRGVGITVIAGYPWFLDWGRDSLICARGLLAAGMVEEVKQLLITYGRFEANGTLPNSIHGEDASNRDTSDAPLWFGAACEELAPLLGQPLREIAVEKNGRTLPQILQSIAEGYLRGTPNGIRVDPASGLVWSPNHFTWMDTNHPAGTPRAGYPVEIQVLWIRLLRQLARLGSPREGSSWSILADRAEASFFEHFWIDQRGYLADALLAAHAEPAAQAGRDDALRSNYLMAVGFGLVTGERARRCVEAAVRYLIVPGALRSLAPLPVSTPLPIYGHHGLLNDPRNPYWGQYEGDEDTRRKPAYHNGTAWTWTFPTFCEALARAWDFQPEAVAAARAYLRSSERLLNEGCLGHLPEILDGDAPHQQRGCDAQAWAATEALRVWKVLTSIE
ncbi:MAG: glycogen debranching enzyme N-terminal domain-containing protein [Verrucomicrobiales bacterium]|nr:glycogen debranching enzyme N-terminal domain-containing protein [Verrucomicrobiales bacterium]